MDLKSGNEVQPMAGPKSEASHYGGESLGSVGNSNSGTSHYGGGPSGLVESNAKVQHLAGPKSEPSHYGGGSSGLVEPNAQDQQMAGPNSASTTVAGLVGNDVTTVESLVGIEWCKTPPGCCFADRSPPPETFSTPLAS